MKKFFGSSCLFASIFFIAVALVTIILGNTNVLAQSSCPSELYGDCPPSSTPSLQPPQIDFYATQYSLPYAGTTMLMWKVKYATTCNLFKNGSLWLQGVNPVEGYNQQSNIVSTLTFKMVCTNNGGSAEKSVTISVTGGGGGASFKSRLTTYYYTSSSNNSSYNHNILPGMTYAEAVGVSGGSGGGADGWWSSTGWVGGNPIWHHGCFGGTSSIAGTSFASITDASGSPNTISLYVGVGGAAGIKDGGYGPGYGGWGGWSRVTVYRYKTDRSPEIVNDLMPEPSGYGYSGAWFVDPNFKCVTYNRFWQVITPITSWTSPRSGLTYDTSIAAQPGSNRVIAPGAGAGGAGSNDTNPNGYRGRDGIVWIYERDQL